MEKNESTRPWNKPSRSRESAENYLRAILEIRSSHGRCRNVDIARHLGISRASVSKALVKLSEAGLVEVVDHDVGFTPEGRAIAEATSARHRFFERLLRDAGVAADEASRDACRLEHCVSADSFEEPCEFLSDFGIMRFAGADVLKCRHRSPSEPLETV